MCMAVPVHARTGRVQDAYGLAQRERAAYNRRHAAARLTEDTNER